jgi:hypothetical protein
MMSDFEVELVNDNSKSRSFTSFEFSEAGLSVATSHALLGRCANDYSVTPPTRQHVARPHIENRSL